MTDFFQDLWHDLREKRLWPLAVAMLLGIVAIPAVLTKSAAEPAQEPTSAVAPVAEKESGSVLALDVESAASSGKGSSLDSFSPDNPFTPPGFRKGAGAEGAETVDVATAGGEVVGSIEVDGGSGGGAPTGGPSPQAPLPVPVAPKTKTEFEYVADITFWQGNDRRTIRGLRKLDMLPNESAPVLIFLGATTDGGDAVFLVDSTLDTAGEGTCSPSRANCTFVMIGPGSEHTFTSETGDSYRLRIDEVRRVKVKASASKSSRPKARTAVGEPAAKPFSLPALVDLVEVAGGGPADAPAKADDAPSNNSKAGR
jgi:hypothetical protein